LGSLFSPKGKGNETIFQEHPVFQMDENERHNNHIFLKVYPHQRQQ